MTFKDVSLTIQSFDFLLLLTSNAYILLCIHHQCLWIQRLSQFLYLTKRIRINSLRLLISSRMCSKIWRTKQKKIRFWTFQQSSFQQSSLLRSSIRLLFEFVERTSNEMSFEDVSRKIQKCNIHCTISTSRWNIACNWDLYRELSKSQRRSWLFWSDLLFRKFVIRFSYSLFVLRMWITTSTKKKSKS